MPVMLKIIKNNTKKFRLKKRKKKKGEEEVGVVDLYLIPNSKTKISLAH